MDVLVDTMIMELVAYNVLKNVVTVTEVLIIVLVVLKDMFGTTVNVCLVDPTMETHVVYVLWMDAPNVLKNTTYINHMKVLLIDTVLIVTLKTIK